MKSLRFVSLIVQSPCSRLCGSVLQMGCKAGKRNLANFLNLSNLRLLIAGEQNHLASPLAALLKAVFSFRLPNSIITDGWTCNPITCADTPIWSSTDINGTPHMLGSLPMEIILQDQGRGSEKVQISILSSSKGPSTLQCASQSG